VTRLGVVRSEWTKLRSLRSTVWTVLVALALMVGIGVALAWVSADQYATPADGRPHGFEAVSVSLNGVALAQLAIGVLGVLAVSAEYGTGMIRATLTVVPSRLPVLWAKLLVFPAVVLPLALAGSVASFLVGQAVLIRSDLGVGFGAPGAVRSVVGAALYLTVAGLIGITLGALVRNTVPHRHAGRRARSRPVRRRAAGTGPGAGPGARPAGVAGGSGRAGADRAGDARRRRPPPHGHGGTERRAAVAEPGKWSARPGTARPRCR
jgi:hypothetical protein